MMVIFLGLKAPLFWQCTIVMILIIAVIHATPRAKASWRLLLISIVFVKLSTLAWIAFPTSIFQLFPAQASEPIPALNDTGPRLIELSGSDEIIASTTEALSSRASIESHDVLIHKPETSWRAIHFLDAFGFLFAMGIFLDSRRRLGIAKRQSKDAPPHIVRELEALRAQLRIRFTPQVLISPHVQAPVCYGVFRKTIFLPQSLEISLSDRQQRIVLAHELTHLKFRDPLFMNLAWLACALWWFHPLAWYSLRWLRRIQEDRCDDDLIREGITTDAQYCETLLNVASSLSRAPFPFAGVAMAPNSTGLARRFERIFNPSIHRGKLDMLSRLTLIAIGLTLVPSAVALPTDSTLSKAIQADLGKGIEVGLAWLKEHQLSDGSFATQANVSGTRVSDHASSLATMAFLGAGISMEHEKYGDALTKALDYLATRFDRTKDNNPWTLDDAVASATLAEAFVLTRKETLRRTLIRCLGRVYAQVNSRSDSFTSQEGMTTAVAFWTGLALASASDGEISVEKEVMTKLIHRALSETTPMGSDWTKGSRAAARYFLKALSGEGSTDDTKTTDLEWVEMASGDLDDSAMNHLGSYAFYQLSGQPEGASQWKTWCERRLDRVIDAQNADGSWNAKDLGTSSIVTTGRNLIAMQIKYRLEKLVSGTEIVKAEK